MDRVEVEEARMQTLKLEVPAKNLLNNNKQDFIANERLYISKLEDNKYRLDEDSKIFQENELVEIGTFELNVDEIDSSYVVHAKSKIIKWNGKYESGHCARGRYDEKLNLIREKRTEFDYMDNARIERILNVRQIQDKLVVKRATKINNDSQHFKAVVNVKQIEDAFILDTGILLIIRYLILNGKRGDFNYFSMNLIGKVIRCHLTIREECEEIKMFHRTFNNSIHVRNIQYFNNCPQEISDTFYTASGKIIFHYWHNSNYILHETKGFISKQEIIVPKLELQWRSNNQLLEEYRLKKKQIDENAVEYIGKHPELLAFLHDYVVNVLKYKPRNVLEFTVKFFQKFKVSSKKF